VARLVEASDAKWQKTRVQCYSGSTGDEEPRSFDIGYQRCEVLDIVERWKAPTHRYFKVKVQGAKFFMLRQPNGGDDWEMSQLNARR